MEQIFARQQLRAIALFMPASDAYIASIRERAAREDLAYQLDVVNDSVKDAVRVVEERTVAKTSLDKLVDVWRRHPLLVGWFGADLLHKLRGR